MTTPTVEVIEHALAIRIEANVPHWPFDPIVSERIDGLGLSSFDVDATTLRGVAGFEDPADVDETLQRVAGLTRDLEGLHDVEVRDDLAMLIVHGTDVGSLHRGVSALAEVGIEVVAARGDDTRLAWLVARSVRQRAAEVLRSIHAPL